MLLGWLDTPALCSHTGAHAWLCMQDVEMVYSTCTLGSVGPRPEGLRTYHNAGSNSHLQTTQGMALPSWAYDFC